MSDEVRRGMGRDIVYLPVYFKDGMLSPAASPFKLEPDGNIHVLADDGKRGKVCLRILSGAPAHSKNVKNLKMMRGSRLVGLTDGKPQTEICQWTDQLEMKMNKKVLSGIPVYRYVRLYLPTDMLCAGEIAFYTDKGRIPAVKVLSDVTPLSAMEGADKLTDGLEATTCRGKVAGRCVDFDLGGLFQLTAVGVYPYLESQIFEDVGYALRYWDDGGWKVKDMKRGTACGWLEFDDVPLNALMVLNNMRWKPFSGERIFICKDESIYWE